MDRSGVKAALDTLTDEEFLHVATVCHDITRRLDGFTALGTAARQVLGLPEPVAPPPEVQSVAPGPNDVTIEMTGVHATSEAGGVG